MSQSGYYIVLDFDGTVVKHRYPAVGEDIGAVPILQRLVQNGHQIILFTMRSHNSNGIDTLQPAIDWFQENNIPLFAINENPTQTAWTSSSKVYGNIYIDDAALGAPLKADEGGSAYINWSVAAIHLYAMGLLTIQDFIDLVKDGIIDSEYISGISK